MLGHKCGQKSAKARKSISLARTKAAMIWIFDQKEHSLRKKSRQQKEIKMRWH